MAYTVRRLAKQLTPNQVALLDDLEQQCFPDDTPYPKVGEPLTWWIIYDDEGKPVGFAGSKFWKPDNAFFLCRAGILRRARGHGLQRRLIYARIKHARQQGATGVMTYTSIDNYASVNNLIQCGFRYWKPQHPWVGTKDVLYWWRSV